MNHHLADTVPCKVCGQPTRMKGTQLCDRCWELEHRIRLDPEIARRLLAEHDTKRGAPALRGPEEIQRAHDLIAGIVLGETPIKDPKAIDLCCTLGSVLCWALRHDHNKSFAQLLENLEGELHEMGAILRKEKRQ